MDDGERRTRLDACFRAYADRVLAFLLHRTDPETAQDVLQEVFVTAFRKLDELPDPPIGWLFGTARRLLANAHRADRRRGNLALRLVDDVVTRSDKGAATTIDDPVADALAGLLPADREVLTLSAWYELSADEAAEALGCSSSAYRVRLHRARRRLADRLAQSGHPLATAVEGAS